MFNFVVLLSNSFVNLRESLNHFDSTATVEAEFGDSVIEGTEVTLAHHGPRSRNLCPCLNEFPDGVEVEAVGISHFDLDTLGGILAIAGIKPEFPEFWEEAAFVDISGVHKLQNPSPEIQAWWAWSEQNKLFAARDGSVTDVTEFVERAAEVLNKILSGDPDLLEEGRMWAEGNKRLNQESFIEEAFGVIVRVSPRFVNHIYTTPDGATSKAVVAYNTITGTITLSLADPIEGVNCHTIAQKLWGEQAGGHAGIAGSPRGMRMELKHIPAAATILRFTICGGYGY